MYRFESVQRFIDDATDMPGEAVTPVAIHLIVVNEQCHKLDEDTSQRFHKIVAKLLLLSKRARPDILTVVVFLAIRVTSLDNDN